jgi:ribosomal protein S19
MGHLYNNKFLLTKVNKVRYLSYKTWRAVYLITSNPVHHTSEKRIWSRSSIIPELFTGTEIFVHAGKRWHTRRVNAWLVGFKAGEFTWNRRLALFKAKQLRKKNKKDKKNKKS